LLPPRMLPLTPNTASTELVEPLWFFNGKPHYPPGLAPPSSAAQPKSANQPKAGGAAAAQQAETKTVAAEKPKDEFDLMGLTFKEDLPQQPEHQWQVQVSKIKGGLNFFLVVYV